MKDRKIITHIIKKEINQYSLRFNIIHHLLKLFLKYKNIKKIYL